MATYPSHSQHSRGEDVGQLLSLEVLFIAEASSAWDSGFFCEQSASRGCIQSGPPRDRGPDPKAVLPWR